MNKNLIKVLSYYKGHKFLVCMLFLVSLIEITAFLMMPFTIKNFVDVALISNSKSIVMKWIGYYSLAVIGVVFFSFIQSHLFTVINEKVTNDVREELFESILSAEHEKVHAYDKGKLISYIINDSKALAGNIISTLSDVLESSIRLLVASVVLLRVDYQLFLFLLLLLPFYVLNAKLVNKPLMETAKEIQSSNEKLLKISEQMLTTRESLIIDRRQNVELSLFKKTINQLAKKVTVNALWQNTSFTGSLIVYWIAMIMVYIVGGFRVVDGVMTMGTVLFYVQYIDNIFMPCRQIVYANADFQKAMASSDRILDLKDNLGYRRRFEGVKLGQINQLDVKGLSFTYEQEELISDIDFTLSSGDVLGIKGPSGTGKSTLIKLLSGFQEGYMGSVKYNGIPLSDISEDSLYCRIGMLFQNPVIYNEGVDDKFLSNHEVFGQPLFKQLMSEISSNRDGSFGEYGKNLSLGQKQRLSLLRQLISKFDLLYLDEPTASLDAVNKEHFSQLITKLSRQGKMIVIVSHDQNLLCQCNKIIDVSTGV